MDLSKVLGDVYADDVHAPAAAAPVGLAAPDWADDARLDEAFSNWTPGPPPEAPAAEREMAAHLPIGSDVATLTHALQATEVTLEAPSEVRAEVGVDVKTVVAHGWTRGDDDVLPVGRRSGLLSRLSR